MVWLFIAELAGKDLDIGMVLKFLMFGTPRLIPLVLPLTILLSSIMTFGDFAENYEFAAMKSSGISLHRAMRSLVVFIVMLGICVFFFTNNVIPFAEYKFINFRRNIAQVKPAMAIAEGQFNTIGNFNIKVQKKSGEKGEFLDNVIIHKKNQDQSENTTVIKAVKGELISSEKSSVLKLALYDGNYYEEIKKDYENKTMPFVKSSFDKYIWQFTGNKTIQNKHKTMKDIPATSKESDAMSKDLKKRGFTFVGSTICYAYMQAAGMVNDHLHTCFRYREVNG